MLIGRMDYMHPLSDSPTIEPYALESDQRIASEHERMLFFIKLNVN